MSSPEIKSITVLSPEGRIKYHLGEQISSIKEEIISIADNSKISVFVGYDRCQGRVFQVSASCPLVIEYVTDKPVNKPVKLIPAPNSMYDLDNY